MVQFLIDVGIILMAWLLGEGLGRLIWRRLVPGWVLVPFFFAVTITVSAVDLPNAAILALASFTVGAIGFLLRTCCGDLFWPAKSRRNT
mgnify:CR=1 FL=1